MKYLELHMHYCTLQLAHVTWELPDRPKSELMGRKPPAQLKTPTFFFQFLPFPAFILPHPLFFFHSAAIAPKYSKDTRRCQL